MEQDANSQKHHLFGPSSLDRRYSCHRSMAEEKDKPSNSSDDSRLGDAYHAEMHKLFVKITDSEGHLWPFEPTWFDGLSDLAAVMLDRVMTIVAGTSEWQTAHISPKIRIFSEITLTLDDSISPIALAKAGEGKLFGTADVVVVKPDEVVVIDFKTGHNEPVKADDTLQTAAYALMACVQFKKEQAWAHIINPNFRQEEGYFFTEDALKKVYHMILEAIEANTDAWRNPKDEDYHPTEENCRYCKGNLCGTCKAVQRMMQKVAESPAAIAPKKDEPLPLASVTDEELVSLKETCKIVEKAMKAIDDELKRRCEENGSCGGYFLKKQNGARKITDLNAAFNLSVKYLKPKQFLELCSVSVPALKTAWATAMKESGDVKTKKEAENCFDTIFGECLGYGEDRTVLAKSRT